MVTISGTIIGGVIAGGAGVVSQAYALKQQSVARKVNWCRQLEHLCSRLETDLNEENHDHHKKHPTQRQYTRTAEIVLPEIDRHFGLAPIEIPEDIHQSHDTATKKFTNFARFQTGKRSYVSTMNSVADEAREIKSWAHEMRAEYESSNYYRPFQSLRRLFLGIT